MVDPEEEAKEDACSCKVVPCLGAPCTGNNGIEARCSKKTDGKGHYGPLSVGGRADGDFEETAGRIVEEGNSHDDEENKTDEKKDERCSSLGVCGIEVSIGDSLVCSPK